MAEVVLRARLAAAGLDGRVLVDSAGTGDWHLGEPMHKGSRTQLAARGYDGSAHRARQFRARWLAERDLILAMDARTLATLRLLAANPGTAATVGTADTGTADTAGTVHAGTAGTGVSSANTDVGTQMATTGTANTGTGSDNDRRIRLFGEVAGLDSADVPDPYGSNGAAFARVLDMLESGMARLVDRLRTLLEPAAED